MNAAQPDPTPVSANSAAPRGGGRPLIVLAVLCLTLLLGMGSLIVFLLVRADPGESSGATSFERRIRRLREFPDAIPLDDRKREWYTVMGDAFSLVSTVVDEGGRFPDAARFRVVVKDADTADTLTVLRGESLPLRVPVLVEDISHGTVRLVLDDAETTLRVSVGAGLPDKGVVFAPPSAARDFSASGSVDAASPPGTTLDVPLDPRGKRADQAPPDLPKAPDQGPRAIDENGDEVFPEPGPRDAGSIFRNTVPNAEWAAFVKGFREELLGEVMCLDALDERKEPWGAKVVAFKERINTFSAFGPAVGDVVIELFGHEVYSRADFDHAAAEAPVDDVVEIVFDRAGQIRKVIFERGAPEKK